MREVVIVVVVGVVASAVVVVVFATSNMPWPRLSPRSHWTVLFLSLKLLELSGQSVCE